VITVGEITGSSVRVNKDGVKPVRLLQVVVSDPEDVQTVELIRQAGEDYNPPKGSRVIILDLGSAWQVGVAVDDGITPEVDEGERELFSSVGGVKKAKFKLNKEGELVLNDGTDFGVAFNELKSGFDQLKNDYNTFLSQIFNLHTHTSAAPGSPTGVPVPVGTSSTASVDGAKVTKVRI
jgi:hypothetical protein